MGKVILCGECGGIEYIEMGPRELDSTGSSSFPGFCDCPARELKRLRDAEDNQPNIDMGDYEYDPVAKIHFMKPKKSEEPKMTAEEEQEMAKAYADYATKHEIRFCPECGTALGIL